MKVIYLLFTASIVLVVLNLCLLCKPASGLLLGTYTSVYMGEYKYGFSLICTIPGFLWKQSGVHTVFILFSLLLSGMSVFNFSSVIKEESRDDITQGAAIVNFRRSLSALADMGVGYFGCFVAYFLIHFCWIFSR